MRIATITTALFLIGGILFLGLDTVAAPYETREEKCLEASNQEGCISEKVQEKIRERGLRAGFQLLRTFTAENPLLKCHAIAHDAGKAGYERFISGKSLKFIPELADCSFGFYHGFFEAFLWDGNEPETARVLCEELESHILDGRSVLSQCFHGFGHGLVDGNDPRFWGDADKFIAPGLEVCGTLTRNAKERRACAGGVYNSLGELYLHEKYGLSFDVNDPYALCREQTVSEFREACYFNLHPALAVSLNNRLLPSLRKIERVIEEADATAAARSLATFYSRLVVSEDVFPLLVATCYKIQEKLQHPCVAGFASGLLLFGEPGMEYRRAIHFCKESTLREEHRDVCFQTIGELALPQYGVQKYPLVCARFPEKYQHRCQEEAIQHQEFSYDFYENLTSLFRTDLFY